MKSLIIALFLGITLTATVQNMPGFTPVAQRDQLETEKKYKSLTDWSAYRKHLQTITREPNTAGSPANERVRDYMSSVMTHASWKTDIYPYDLYMPKEPVTSQVAIAEPIRLP